MFDLNFGLFGNSIVCGAPATGKTTAFVIPAASAWPGPVVILTNGSGTYESLVLRRAHSGQTLLVDLSSQPLAVRTGTLNLVSALSNPTGMRLSTTVVSVAVDELGAMLTRPGVVEGIAKSIIADIGQMLHAQAEVTRGQRVGGFAPLLIVDDYWALAAPFVREILDATSQLETASMVTIFVTQYVAALRRNLGDVLYRRVLDRCPTRIQFRHNGCQTEPIDQAQADFVGVPLAELRSLRPYEVFVRDRGIEHRQQLVPYWRSDAESKQGV